MNQHKNKNLRVPILFLVFNRFDTTKKVFEEIKRVKPKKLFISSDGPREDKRKEKEAVEIIRKYLLDKIDWNCKVKTLFRNKNLGCKKAVSSAIDWFFENVEQGIVLEDDCFPSPDFFKFCEEMLEKYRDDERIMHISGNNFLGNWRRDKYSYYFSKYPFIWGWATWRRAWKKYNINMQAYPEFKKKKYLKDISSSRLEEKYIKKVMDRTYFNKSDTWDYQWFFTLLINNGLSIVPNENLVRNIGFDIDHSTHTKAIDSFLSIPTEKLKFPLKHPHFIIRDKKADERYVKWLFKNRLKKYFLLKTGLHKLIR